MTITPSGAPAWVRSVGFEDYGGHADKTNFQSLGLINARTDVGAEAFSRMVSHLASVTRTAPLATLYCTADDTGTADPTVNSIQTMTGVRSTSYPGGSAPSGFPSVTRNGNGDYYVTFPKTLSDEFGVSGTVNIRGATGSVHGERGTVNPDISGTEGDPDSDGAVERVRVYVFQGASALADSTFSLTVY